MKNDRKKRESDPKIKALGWEDLDPSALIDSAIDKFKQSAERAKLLAQCSVHPDPDRKTAR